MIGRMNVSKRPSLSALVWGVLSVVAGALMAEGGVREVLAYWPQREALPIGVGALGACASALLLVSGVAFCTRRPLGRGTAMAGAAGMIPVHFLGWISGVVGVPGALLGVVYPTLLLVVLKVRPNLGAPIIPAGGATSGGTPAPGPHLDRIAVVIP